MCQNKSVHLTVWKPEENTSLMFEQYSVTCPEIRVCIILFLASTSVLKPSIKVGQVNV